MDTMNILITGGNGYIAQNLFIGLASKYNITKIENIQHWQDVSFDYLMNRPNLKRIFLLIDVTKGLKNHDLEVINIFIQNNIFFQIVLTKIDKLNMADQEKSAQEIIKKLEVYPSFCKKIVKTSSSKKYGITELQDEIVEILNNL